MPQLARCHVAKGGCIVGVGTLHRTLRTALHNAAYFGTSGFHRETIRTSRSHVDNATIIYMARVPWVVEFHPTFEGWADGLARPDAEALLAAVRVLRDQGPSLGRPLVDTVEASRHANMKELRPGSTGRSEIRVLFAFDRVRQAILLVGGDKSDDWSGWYRVNIPIADDRFDEHQSGLGSTNTTDEERTRTKKSRRRP